MAAYTAPEEMALVLFCVIVVSMVGSAAYTNAVVAICVVLVPTAAVGAVGTPVKAGESNN